MKRYSTEHDDEPFEFDTGEYVLYEEAHQVEIDRDIKAANLQLLVDAVLAADLMNLSTGRDISPRDEEAEGMMLLRLENLARGLKQ